VWPTETSPYNLGLVVIKQLLVNAHLIQYLNGCIAYSTGAVFVTWKLFLLQQQRLAAGHA